MCYAAAIPYVMAALSAYGAYTSSSAQKSAAEYQARIASNNASLAQTQAADAKARGDTEAANVHRKYALLLGTQRANLAARGLDISDGSPNAILQDTTYFSGMDESTTRANAAREAWGYRVRADNFSAESAAYSAQAGAINPLLSAGMAGVEAYLRYQPEERPLGPNLADQGGDGGETLFGSSTSVASKWYRGSSKNWGRGTSNPWGGQSADPWYG